MQSQFAARELTLQFWVLVVHFINHQTHQRGLLTTLVNKMSTSAA